MNIGKKRLEARLKGIPMILFKEYLKEDRFQLNKQLIKEERYFAHTKNGSKVKESLVAHTKLVLEYFIKLCDATSLEAIIDTAINKYVGTSCFINKDKVSELIKLLFLNSIYFHDFGKVNDNFQRIKMENDLFQRVINGIDSQHSILSAYLFISSNFYEVLNSNLENKDKNLLLGIVLLFSYPILKHHSFVDDANDVEFKNDIIKYLSDFRKIFTTLEAGDQKINNFLQDANFYEQIKNDLTIGFEFFVLMKLNSSLLTASDYYATNQFMSGLIVNDFGIVNDELKNKIVTNTYKISYNKNLRDNFNQYNKLKFSDLTDFSNTNLNLLRQKISAEVITNIRRNLSKKLFYIEAPTGAGKTNLSLLALTEILNKRNDVTKIFYVFPFTTLITQTYKFICDSLDLSYSEIAEMHSKAPFRTNNNNPTEQDAVYDADWKNYIDNLFVNYPITLLSHVKFFDILTSNDKEVNYLLHRLANTVVIIDELQSYNPAEWDKINYLLQKYSETMNITFIIMSATLPKISKLFLDKGNMSKDDFVYLIQDKKEYFSNPNFKNRVQIRLDYLKEGCELDHLGELLHKHSEDYFRLHNGVKSIIEFVTKKTAHKFYETIYDLNFFCDYDVYLITGTILEPRRKEIISYLKSDESNHKKILVICTQVIEAGLDIDMDLGFKDKAILDSEEQFAGRINRNANKIHSELFIFNTGDRTRVYANDLRFAQIDELLYESVVQTKDFDLLYEKVFERINRLNDDPFLANNLSDFITQIQSLRFGEVKKMFNLIKDNTASVFVPCEIGKKHFNPAELQFLLQFHPDICTHNMIDGEVVWEIYVSIITNKEKTFSSKVDHKIISSLISKFVFNVWKNPATLNLLLQRSDSGELKYGFVKLSKHFYSDVYSYETGLKTDLETDVNII